MAAASTGFRAWAAARRGRRGRSRASTPTCRRSPSTSRTSPRRAGLDRTERVGRRDREEEYILETTGTGVALFDYDNDGRVDIFIPNGDHARCARGASATPPTGHLYRNLGGLRFEDVTARAGARATGWGQGVCVGDYDNDGHRDLFVTYYGQSVLCAQRGDGSFDGRHGARGARGGRRAGTRAVRSSTTTSTAGSISSSPAISNSIATKIPEPGAGGYCQWKGIPVMCGPRGLPFARNRLFHNEGKGRFADVSLASGIGKTKGCYGFTVVASDFDNDGYPDLYVACDSTPSLLYHNNKDGTFEDVGLLSGAALNEDGQEQGGMGVAVADYDEDGDMDIVKTNFSDDVPNVYHNNGDGTFEDRVLQSGLGGYMQYVGWGVHLADVDHDGRRDLLMINGHVYPGSRSDAGDPLSPAAPASTGTSAAASSRTCRRRPARPSRRRCRRAARRWAIWTTTGRSKSW